MNNIFEKWSPGDGQFPRSLDGMSSAEKLRVLEEVQRNKEIEFEEEREFFDRISRIFDSFCHHGFSENASIQLTIAFLNDPIFNKKRSKRRTITEIINRINSEYVNGGEKN